MKKNHYKDFFMKVLNLNTIKNKLFELSSLEIFVLSILICLIFYLIEGLLGIDRFYHPDSAHYLSNYQSYELKDYISNPLKIFSLTYYHITNLFNDNYHLLILLNFILYSYANVMIYQKIFKKYFNAINNIKLFFLFYLFFLDPYRLHLACHVLKETLLIFLMILIILSNMKSIKILSIVFLESVRQNAWIYLIIFFTYSNIKKIFTIKIFLIVSIVLFLVLISFFLFDQNFFNSIQTEYNNFINMIKNYDKKQMPVRSFDHVTQFKNFEFPIGFILKNITWPFMLVSGFFIFFVSSFLFKFLGIIIVINNLIVFLITKKTYISVGLLIILIMISVYSSSYTAMFRYSYIALYASIVYFFSNFNLKKL